jgi:CheY-like chemotaxis protein
MKEKEEKNRPHCHILMADDESDLLDLLTQLLTRNGYSVEGTTSGKEVKRMIDKRRPDIILLDVHMGDADGAEICRELKLSPVTATIPVVMISANDNLAQLATQIKADSFIAKPVHAHQLLDQIARLIDTKFSRVTPE